MINFLLMGIYLCISFSDLWAPYLSLRMVFFGSDTQLLTLRHHVETRKNGRFLSHDTHGTST